MVSHNILTCQLEFLLLTKHRYIAKWGKIDINIPYSALTLQSSRFYLYLVFLVQVGNSNLTKARLNESAIQCDKIGRNFSTLVKFFKSLAIFWGFTFATFYHTGLGIYFHCCQLLNIEKIIRPSCPTGLPCWKLLSIIKPTWNVNLIRRRRWWSRNGDFCR